MASIEELQSARLLKIQKLINAGMDPYPAYIPRDHSILEVKISFEEHIKQNKSLSIAGRVMIIRGQGAILFIVLQDGKER